MYIKNLRHRKNELLLCMYYQQTNKNTHKKTNKIPHSLAE